MPIEVMPKVTILKSCQLEAFGGFAEQIQKREASQESPIVDAV